MLLWTETQGARIKLYVISLKNQKLCLDRENFASKEISHSLKNNNRQLRPLLFLLKGGIDDYFPLTLASCTFDYSVQLCYCEFSNRGQTAQNFLALIKCT